MSQTVIADIENIYGFVRVLVLSYQSDTISIQRIQDRFDFMKKKVLEYSENYKMDELNCMLYDCIRRTYNDRLEQEKIFDIRRLLEFMIKMNLDLNKNIRCEYI